MKTCPECGKHWPDDAQFCGDDATPLSPPTQNPEELIVGHYRILERLGGGGMGTVYVGEHLSLGRRDAVKMLNLSMADDPEALARFHREAKNASTIRHENVCVVYHFGETPDGISFLAMELVEGVSLAELLDQEGGFLEPVRAARIIRQVADGLQAAHDRNIVHRDLKPGNIMVAPKSGGGDLVKVVDFGIAKAMGHLQDQEITQIGLVAGTPEYMSPEHLRGEEPDPRSDIYALGVVLFKTLTGKLPFSREHPGPGPMRLDQARPGVEFPAGLQEIIDSSLAHDPKRRFQTARAFGEALERAVHAPVPATMVGGDTSSPSAGGGRAGPRRAVVLGLLSAGAVAAAGTLWVLSGGAEAGRLVLAGTSMDLAAGDSTTLTALGLSASGDTVPWASSVVWVSAESEVAQVDEAGNVIAGQKAGEETTLMAIAAQDTARLRLRVVPGAPSEVVLLSRTQLRAGATQTFAAEVYDRYSNPIDDARLTWSSDQPDVVSVSDDGAGRALAAGPATVRLTVESSSGDRSLEQAFQVAVAAGGDRSDPNQRTVPDDPPPPDPGAAARAQALTTLKRLCEEIEDASTPGAEDRDWARNARTLAEPLFAQTALGDELRRAAAEVVSWAFAILGEQTNAELWEGRAGGAACIGLRRLQP